jgi:hypothetical protein
MSGLNFPPSEAKDELRRMGLFIAGNVVGPVLVSWLLDALPGVGYSRGLIRHVAYWAPLALSAASYYASIHSETGEFNKHRAELVQEAVALVEQHAAALQLEPVMPKQQRSQSLDSSLEQLQRLPPESSAGQNLVSRGANRATYVTHSDTPTTWPQMAAVTSDHTREVWPE